MTNMSTGKLGVTLANFLTDEGHAVICLKGEGSTCPGAVRAARLETFATNDDLTQRLESISRLENFDAVFHAAALCDYRVDQVLNDAGEAISSAKFATRDGRLHLILATAMKVLPRMRDWFPDARIVGWKHELAGTRDDAFAKAWKQLYDGQTDACGLNGAAYGRRLCHLPRGRAGAIVFRHSGLARNAARMAAFPDSGFDEPGAPCCTVPPPALRLQLSR